MGVTDAALVLMVQHAPQQLSVSAAHVGLDQAHQLLPHSLAHHLLLAVLPPLLQHAERSQQLVSLGPDQLPNLLLTHTHTHRFIS